MDKLLAVVLLALSTGIDNFVVSAAIGLAGINARHKIRIALTIGIFETAMTIAGLFLGDRASGLLGGYTHWVGGLLLLGTGIYIIYSAKKGDQSAKKKTNGKLAQQLITAMSLSIDNLIVGFSIGSQKIPINEAILVIAVISMSLSLIGMELGTRLSHKIEEYSEIISGIIIIGVGLAITFKIL
ncbi:MAG: manganese efflux pump [bacterium]|jgi:manganese efflux pump family protein